MADFLAVLIARGSFDTLIALMGVRIEVLQSFVVFSRHQHERSAGHGA